MAKRRNGPMKPLKRPNLPEKHFRWEIFFRTHSNLKQILPSGVLRVDSMVTEEWYVRAGVLTMFAESFEQARVRWMLSDVRQMDGCQIEQVFRTMVPELVRLSSPAD